MCSSGDSGYRRMIGWNEKGVCLVAASSMGSLRDHISPLKGWVAEKKVLSVPPAWICLFCVIVAAVLLITTGSAATGDDRFLVLGFAPPEGDSCHAIPDGWETLTFIGTEANEFSMSREHGVPVLHVKSLNSASGVLKRLNTPGGPVTDLRTYPLLVWRWKISRTVGMAVEERKDRNDCAARVRVIFNSVPISRGRNDGVRKAAGFLGIDLPTAEPPGYKIDYIWSARLPKNRIVDYPGEKRHTMVVLRQGNGNANRWIWEQRDLIDDFRQCFGDEPPGIAGVVILTDTDQTNEGVEAWYGSVVMVRRGR